jgi:hypothetical protein
MAGCGPETAGDGGKIVFTFRARAYSGAKRNPDNLFSAPAKSVIAAAREAAY